MTTEDHEPPSPGRQRSGRAFLLDPTASAGRAGLPRRRLRHRRRPACSGGSAARRRRRHPRLPRARHGAPGLAGGLGPDGPPSTCPPCSPPAPTRWARGSPADASTSPGWPPWRATVVAGAPRHRGSAVRRLAGHARTVRATPGRWPFTGCYVLRELRASLHAIAVRRPPVWPRARSCRPAIPSGPRVTGGPTTRPRPVDPDATAPGRAPAHAGDIAGRLLAGALACPRRRRAGPSSGLLTGERADAVAHAPPTPDRAPAGRHGRQTCRPHSVLDRPGPAARAGIVGIGGRLRCRACTRSTGSPGATSGLTGTSWSAM